MIKRTLMQRNQELVDFEIEPASGKTHIIDASEAGFKLIDSLKLKDQSENSAITRLIHSRTISKLRPDLENILASFNAKSATDLALMSHGLSLYDQYWYRTPGSTERWQDINFFNNEWDPSFGEAVLTEDYARLTSCSPEVPDVTTSGHAAKTWERTDKGIFFIKVSKRYEGAELVGIKLASDLCTRIFNESDFVPIEVSQRYGIPCSISPIMIASNEELANGNHICAMTGIQDPHTENGPITAEICESRAKVFEAIGIKNSSAHIARIACYSCLSLLADFHAGNYGAIHNIDSDAWRAAPLFDYDGSFGFPFNRVEIPSLCARPALLELMCAQQLSYLHPSWDWSWYNPQALDDFENHILEAYAPYTNMPSNFAEIVARLFVMQRNYVNRVATGEPI